MVAINSTGITAMHGQTGSPTSRKELGLTTAYTFNNLNQFSSGSWTGSLTVVGEVNYAAGTVTVNSVTAKLFPDRVFEATNITVSAGTNVLTAVYHGPAFTNTQMVATNTSTVVMATPVFAYDTKGNLTNDAEFVYQYDIANRLTNVVSKESGSSVMAVRYDGLGRRVEVTRNGSTVERYVYFPGSFLALAVLDGSNQVKEIYTHGPDLSGTVGGAGGIGGILSVTTNVNDSTARKYFHADAMGNVVLVSGPDGKQVAAYGYTPFGKLINQVGEYQARFLFSSKELDPETGLINFGLRLLNTRQGAWLTRDPAGEGAGVNLYAFVENDPVNWFDDSGLRRRRRDRDRPLGNLVGAHRFVWHFYTGGGRSVDIGEWGYLGNYRSAIDVRTFECEARNRVRRSVDDGTHRGTYRRLVDGTDGLYVMGNGFLNADWKCDIGGGLAQCTIAYNIRDSFEDPIDLESHVNRRLPGWFPRIPDVVVQLGGTPYPLIANWTVECDGCSEIEDCGDGGAGSGTRSGRRRR